MTDVTMVSVNKEALVDIQLSHGIGLFCPYCGHKFESVEDIKEREVVVAVVEPFAIACEECWRE